MRRSLPCCARVVALGTCLAQGPVLAVEEAAAPPSASNAVPAGVSTNPVGEAAAERPSGRGFIWGFHWDDGLHYELGSTGRLSRLLARHPDADVKPYQGKIGLKLHYDAADYHADSDLGDIPDDTGIRRARLYTSGSLFLGVPMSYKVEAEVADDEFFVRETYLWLSDIRFIQSLKIGHFKAPMTLEGYTSSGDTLFLERASPVEAFGPGIMFGIQPTGVSEDKRRTWAFGWFADGGQNDNASEASRSPSRVIGRTTWLPVQGGEEERTKLIHLGASAEYLYSDQRAVRFESRPESYFAPRLADTGDIDARNSVTWGVEFAAVNGSLSLQSEFLQALVSREDEAGLGFQGCYVTGSWLLTGESRPYNRNLGAFGQVVPRRNFSFRDRTFGAWELVARYSHLNLNSEDVNGGRMNLATVGLNVHLTSRVRLMFDYAFGRVDRDGEEGDLQILEGRVQYDL